MKGNAHAEPGRLQPPPNVATPPRLKQTKKSYTGAGLQKKMLINNVRSRNVYENKQNYDTLSHEKSDIYVEVTRILQKIAGCEGQFGASGGFGARWGRNLAI